MWNKQIDNSFNYLEEDYNEYSDPQHQLEPSSFIPTPMPNYINQIDNGHKNTMHNVNERKDEEKTNRDGSYQLTFKKQRGIGNRFNSAFASSKHRLFDNHNPQHRHQHQSQYSQTLNLLNSQPHIPSLFLTLASHHSSLLHSQSHLLNLLQQQQSNLIIQQQTKIQLLLLILQIKIYRKKINNAKINLQYVRLQLQDVDSSVCQMNRKKEDVLGMILVMLEKKLGIAMIRLSGKKKMWIKMEKERMEFEKLQNNGIEDSFQNGRQYEQQQYWPSKHHKQGKQTIDVNEEQIVTKHKNKQVNKVYYHSVRLTIFTQIISTLVNRKQFPFFKILTQFTNNHNPHHNTHRYTDNQHSDHDQSQHQGHTQINQLSNYQDDQNIQQNNQDPITSILQYIQSLKSKLIRIPKNQHQLLHNYFIKWKIFFLYNIIKKIQDQQQQQHVQKSYMESVQEDVNVDRGEKQYGSMKSVNGDLKQEKTLLKNYLRENRFRELLKFLAENKASRSLKQIMREYYHKSLKRKVFDSFVKNREEFFIQRYASEVADNQQQSHQTTAKIFYKTNCLAKVFFGLKNVTKCSKFQRTIESFLVKYAMNTLKEKNIKQQQCETRLSKFRNRKNKKLLFNCFKAIKNQTSFSQHYESKIQIFKRKRNLQITDFCFSLLSLEVKKKLAVQKRLENYLVLNSTRLFFSNLYENYRDQLGLSQRVYISSRFIAAYRKLMFFKHFKKFSGAFQENRKIEIKSVKFAFQKTKKNARETLSRWRKQTIYRKNYKMIQEKLGNVKRIQTKQKLFNIWLERLQQKNRDRKKDKLTNNHRIWLSKYYQRLCLLEQP